MLPSLFPLVIVLVIVVAAVYRAAQWQKHRPSFEEEPGIGTARRLYLYVVALAALMAGANGLVQIGRFVLDDLFGSPAISQSTTQLAIGLALAIVGLPLWAWHWRMAARALQEHPSEAGALLRKLYVYAVLGIAVGLLLHAATGLAQWILRAHDFSGYHWAAVVAWSVVWAFYWRVEAREGQPNDPALAVRRLYVYIASGVMLAVLATGAARVVHILLLSGYDALASAAVLAPGDNGLWREAVRTALASALVCGVGWGFHWLRLAWTDRGSTLRRLYMAGYASIGGLATAMVATGVVVYGLLIWGFGAVGAGAAEHFRFFPGTIASLSAGLAVGVYHFGLARDEEAQAKQERREVGQWYPYILAAAGLALLAVGVASAVATAVLVLTGARDGILVNAGEWRKGIALVVTLWLLGGPLWQRYWLGAQQRVAAGAEERVSPPRRTLELLAVGAGLLAFLGSLSHMLFVVLRDLLDGDLGRMTVHDATVSLGILAAVAVFVPYYWLVYRSDQRAGGARQAQGQRVRKAVMVLAGAGDDAAVRAIEAALGYDVEQLMSADPAVRLPALTPADAEALVRQIGAATTSKVLLVPDGERVRVLPYR
ncbi:MAG: hypothetical protein EXR48_07440 [Dehalococcoidia bacterium]|nr:hypothetical protein [Dehalococcoidia bacterium]